MKKKITKFPPTPPSPIHNDIFQTVSDIDFVSEFIYLLLEAAKHNIYIW